ncbi:hypothetical protein [Desulforamulus reducens]|nr:hypothetical protein [Desulforamulus reducens]
MTSAQFIEWVQEKFNSCNVHNEMETSELIREVIRKYYSLGQDEKQNN